jgi:hypothetical protein
MAVIHSQEACLQITLAKEKSYRRLVNYSHILHTSGKALAHCTHCTNRRTTFACGKSLFLSFAPVAGG